LEMRHCSFAASTSDGHEYHLQVTASGWSGVPMPHVTAVPDLDLLDALRANQNPGGSRSRSARSDK
jgi:hypothetical protein